MAIRLLCTGRLKEPHFRDAQNEYLKRMGRYARVEIVEFKEQSENNPEISRKKEAKPILERMGDGFAVALDSRGCQMTSEEFAKLLKTPDLSFILGGPDGLAQEVIDKADTSLSLGKMTYPHQLARVMLIEQIYRGFTILNGGQYHK
jgi:23S rRNA (pseudouridine1915-N3)-methyltransferase